MNGFENAHKRGVPGPLDRASLAADKAHKGMVEPARPLPDSKSKPARPRRGGMRGQWNKRMYGA